MSDLCRAIGYHVKSTTRSRDSGVDVFAKRSTDTGEDSIIVQCKHRPNATIGVSTERELYGVLASRPDIGRTGIITSGRFSQDALAFAAGKKPSAHFGIGVSRPSEQVQGFTATLVY